MAPVAYLPIGVLPLGWHYWTVLTNKQIGSSAPHYGYCPVLMGRTVGVDSESWVKQFHSIQPQRGLQVEHERGTRMLSSNKRLTPASSH